MESEIEFYLSLPCKRCPDTPSEGGGTWVFFIRTTCPDRICYHPDRASGHTIGRRRDVWHHTFHPDVSHPKFCPANVLSYPDVSHPEFCLTNVLSYPDVSHPEFCCAAIPLGCITSGILTLDGRGERFNFPGHTYPDPLIALTWRVSQSFCTVPRCSPEAPDMSNRHFEIFFCTVPRCSPEATRYVRPTL